MWIRGMGTADWGPMWKGSIGGGIKVLPADNFYVTAQNNGFFFIDFHIIETLYIPVTIVNSDHAVKLCGKLNITQLIDF